jgi:hypothetical protein
MNRRAFFRKTVGLFVTAAAARQTLDLDAFAAQYLRPAMQSVVARADVVHAQRLYNFYQSAMLETIALAPRAPWKGPQ